MVETATHVDFRYVIVELSIVAFFYFSVKYDRKHKTYHTVNILFYGLWAIAIAFLLFVYSHVDPEHPEKTTVFIPLGMIIAAMLASLSVMKNISETKVNEEVKFQRDIDKEILKENKDLSKFHLDKCTDALKHFYDLLKDGNNDRATWLQASRILLLTQDLSKNITDSNHKNVYEIEVSKIRFALWTLYRSPIKGITINERFFLGGDFWKDDLPSYEAIIKQVNPINYLDEYSVYVIFSFLDYPENYSDPLDKVDPIASFDESKWRLFPKKQAGDFIKEREKYYQQNKEDQQ